MTKFNACPPSPSAFTQPQRSNLGRALACSTSLQAWSALASVLASSACAVDPGTAQPDVLNPTVSFAADTATALPTAGRYSTYIALGDSYSSANGVENEGPVCMRGDGAWPHLLQPNLPLQDPSQLAVLEACSGATTAGILGVEQGMPPQINKVTSIAPATLESALITITIGGNDIGVSTELGYCLAGDCTKNEQRILGNIAKTRAKLLTTFKELRRVAPKATIVAVGYPHLVAATATTSCTDDPTSEIELAERAMIRRTIDVMNATIKSAAADATIDSVIDEVVAAFEGREACAGTGNDFIHKVEEAALLVGIFHPNAAGNEAYSEAVLKGLARVPSASPVAQPQPATATATTTAPGVAATPSSTPIIPATPVRSTAPTPVPTATTTPKPTSTSKPTAGSASTPGSTPEESDAETDPDSEADSDDDTVDTDGEDDDTEDEDGSGSDDDAQEEGGEDDQGDGQEDDGEDTGDEGQEDDGEDTGDEGQEDDS
jgi:lysophospholipase L1-like esterase